MYYMVYKTINKINGKVYIGKHQTENLDDDYLGSGKLLKRAIKTHGLRNFIKEILFVFDTIQEMNDKEKELVTEEFCKQIDTYNICEGGKGGFGFINKNNLQSCSLKRSEVKTVAHRLSAEKRKWLWENDINWRFEHSLRCSKAGLNSAGFKGKLHTKESKIKIGQSNSEKQRGSKNSQYGSFWITNGIENKKSRDVIPEGWYKGRINFSS